MSTPGDTAAEHGTRSRYVLGCRCQDCTRANTEGERQRRKVNPPRRPSRATGIAADPAYRSERARKAAIASHSIDARIKALVARAPELTAEQREQLALLLHPGGTDRVAS